MNSQQINQVISDTQRKKSFEIDPKTITTHRILRNVLRKKHKGLGNAARFFYIDARNFSTIIWGVSSTIRVITAIQKDLNLSDEQVLQLWPQLQVWPREPYSRVPRKLEIEKKTDETDKEPTSETGKEPTNPVEVTSETEQSNEPIEKQEEAA